MPGVVEANLVYAGPSAERARLPVTPRIYRAAGLSREYKVVISPLVERHEPLGPLEDLVFLERHYELGR